MAPMRTVALVLDSEATRIPLSSLVSSLAGGAKLLTVGLVTFPPVMGIPPGALIVVLGTPAAGLSLCCCFRLPDVVGWHFGHSCWTIFSTIFSTGLSTILGRKKWYAANEDRQTLDAARPKASHAFGESFPPAGSVDNSADLLRVRRWTPKSGKRVKIAAAAVIRVQTRIVSCTNNLNGQDEIYHTAPSLCESTHSQVLLCAQDDKLWEPLFGELRSPGPGEGTCPYTLLGPRRPRRACSSWR